jgi:hypothetical protein
MLEITKVICIGALLCLRHFRNAFFEAWQMRGLLDSMSMLHRL